MAAISQGGGQNFFVFSAGAEACIYRSVDNCSTIRGLRKISYEEGLPRAAVKPRLDMVRDIEFLPRDALVHSAVLRLHVVRPSVCPSVRL